MEHATISNSTIALALLSAACIHAGPFHLSGTVLDPSGKPLAGATVLFALTGDATSTDSAGLWTISGSIPTPSGVAPATNPRPSNGGRLFEERGRLRMAFQGRDIVGRNLAVVPPTPLQPSSSAPRSAGSTSDQPLLVAWNGVVRVRLNVLLPSFAEIFPIDTATTDEEFATNDSVPHTTMTDPRDGQTYRVVKIGSQTWMAQNLNYNAKGSHWFEDSAKYGAQYGRLYTWAVAMGLPDSCLEFSCSTLLRPKTSGACPEGWHVPSRSEWLTLAETVGGENVAGWKLKASNVAVDTYGWNGSPIVPGTDSWGFRALFGGYRQISEQMYASLDRGGFWWGADELQSESDSTWDPSQKHASLASFVGMDYMNNKLISHPTGSNKLEERSIRCLRDE